MSTRRGELQPSACMRQAVRPSGRRQKFRWRLWLRSCSPSPLVIGRPRSKAGSARRLHLSGQQPPPVPRSLPIIPCCPTLHFACRLPHNPPSQLHRRSRCLVVLVVLVTMSQVSPPKPWERNGAGVVGAGAASCKQPPSRLSTFLSSRLSRTPRNTDSTPQPSHLLHYLPPSPA